MSYVCVCVCIFIYIYCIFVNICHLQNIAVLVNISFTCWKTIFFHNTRRFSHNFSYSSKIQSFTRYLRLTLVFVWNRALQEKFNFCYWRVFSFGKEIFTCLWRKVNELVSGYLLATIYQKDRISHIFGSQLNILTWLVCSRNMGQKSVSIGSYSYI